MPPHANKATIRLQVDNVSGFSTLESPSTTIGNNQWTLSCHVASSTPTKTLGLRLTCNKEICSNLWSSQASFQFSLIKFNADQADNAFSLDFSKKFSRGDNAFFAAEFKTFEELIDAKNHFVVGNTMVVEAVITVTASSGFNRPVEETFAEPRGTLSDVTLLIEGRKCHVGKQILALNSRYFEVLFYSGDFQESTKTEIPIEGVAHDEFVEMLNFVYPTHCEIDKSNVDNILRLADRFEMWSVVEKAEKFLISTQEFHVVDKLKYAETYKLASLQNFYCANFETTAEILELSKHENYKLLGDVTLSLLFQKLAEIDKNA